MRGTPARWNTPFHSVCLFCASRLSRPSVVRRPPRPSQQRAFHLSRPSSRPPGAAAALREEDDDDYQVSTSAGPEPRSSRGPNNASAKTASSSSSGATEMLASMLAKKRGGAVQSDNRSFKKVDYGAATPLCWFCKRPGHTRAECTLTDRSRALAQANRHQNRQETCRNCGKEGHSSNACPGGESVLTARSMGDTSHSDGQRRKLFGKSPEISSGNASQTDGQRRKLFGTSPARRLVSRADREQERRPSDESRTWNGGKPALGRTTASRYAGTPGSAYDNVAPPDAELVQPLLDPAFEPAELDEGPPMSRKEEERSRLERLRRREKFVAPDVTADRHHNSDRSRKRDKGRRRFASDAEEDQADEGAARAEMKRKQKLERAARKAAMAPPTPILIPEFISVSNLARALRVRLPEFVARLEELGFEETNYDHVLNSETAGLIAMEYKFEPIIDRSATEDLRPLPPPENKSELPPRPPVVTIMGHVDHGKTTLLDWLRKSSVAASEYGGITQHIGAFSVPMPSGKLITFLDTPGHAAFLSMRQRGANVTDIVILVVAADDSVKPQTIEAIKHAKAAKVPMIVAINKIDKDETNIERVKQDLARHGVEVEDYGGDTQVVPVSGKTGQGMEALEEAAVTLSEILDMRADPEGQAEGWILEATTKKAGRVATVLVRRGTLHPGDILVAGSTWARIRTLKNEAGVEVPSATPGTPVEVDGWREQPSAGDEAIQAPDETKAKSVVSFRKENTSRLLMAKDVDAVNDSRRLEHQHHEDGSTGVAERTSGTGLKEVYLIVKADVSGSVEAVLNSISALGNAEVAPHILRSGVGPISEFDIEHAAATGQGTIIAFNVPVEPAMARLAESRGVKIMENNVIYRLVDDVRAKMSEYLPPAVTTRVVGEAEVAQVFEIGIKGRRVVTKVAGCKVRNGVVGRNVKVRVLRGRETVYDGMLSSLKNVKKDVPEMRKGGECGLGFDGWEEFQVGDQVQCYEEKVEKRFL